MIASRTLLAALLVALPRLCIAQTMDKPVGTIAKNVTSDSTQFTYTSLWRSDTEDGFYQAYSNLSDASVTFSFVGVGATFYSVRKADRGLCQLTVDSTITYTIDLYDDSGFSKGQQAIWSSGTLLYGQHYITLSQIGPDARFGYYPYIITEIWTEFVPINIAAYTATESVPSAEPTSGNSSPNSGPSSVAPIIGGVVGGVVALILISFLLYLWRRDKATQERARREGASVNKVRKAEGMMTIEDEGAPPPPPGGAAHYDGYGGAGMYGVGAQRVHYGGTDPYADPYAPQMSQYGRGSPAVQHPGVAHYGRLPSTAHGQDMSASSTSYGSHHPLAHAGAMYRNAQSSATASSPSNASAYGGQHSYPLYDPIQREVHTRSPRDYPFVTQNLADEQRRLPVPEI